jgi:hypothetical protein
VGLCSLMSDSWTSLGSYQFWREDNKRRRQLKIRAAVYIVLI